MNEPHSEEAADKVKAEVEGNRELQRENSSLQQRLSASFQITGPLPPPITLEQYNRILPDAANRIISMAEREQEHRHKMQEKLVDAQIIDKQQQRAERRLGQIFGFSIGVVVIVAGSATTVLGHPVVGGLFGSSGVIGLVFVFVYSRREQQKAQFPQLESSDIEDEPGSI